MKPYRLILASAGTGKTYQLTGQFLGLLMNGVPPERILATTFTRKAAGEILDRVLRRLVDAASDESARADLDAQLGLEGTPAEEYRVLLAGLARRLDRFKIRTLDAFFVHLAKLFALDLGLPADWAIVEEVEDAAMRREAVARALTRARRDEWIELLRGLQRTDASRSVERALLATVEMGRDAFLDSFAPAWARVEPRTPGLSDEAFAEARAGLEALVLPLTQKGEPTKHWANAKAAMVRAVEGSDWEGYLDCGPVKKLLDGKHEFDRKPIDESMRAVLEPLIGHAAHEVLGRVARQNEATHEWLERFEAAYAGVKREERAYRFEDLPQALAPRGEDRLTERRLDMWYRLDGRIDHLLLDEFQDTSPTQWRILARIAEELFDGSGRRTFFCVGDVKQSIYGWREAEPRLLAQLAERYPLLETETLERSYRSSQVVLDTVDRVFGGIGSSRAFERSTYVEAAREFEADFREHVAAKQLAGGAYLLEALPPDDEEERSLPCLRLAAQRAAQIAREAPGASIGILLRRNAESARLIYLLRQEGLRASGEGGNPLVDSAAVLHLVSLLHLADHPRDTAAAFHLATSPLGPAVDLAPDVSRRRIEDVSRSLRERLATEGYGPFCASLRPAVAAGYGDWDVRRFDQLVDLAYAFEPRAGLRPDLFVDHVRETQVEDPTATQVKVMTVHMAKGLEFDAVILPELDEKFFLREDALMRLRPDPAGLLESVSVSVAREVCALDSEVLGPLRDDQDRRGLREALCLLYVAMTRAARRIDMIVRARKPGGKVPHTFAGILRDALVTGPPVDGVLWSHPDSSQEWFPRSEEAAAPPAATPAAVALFKPSSGARGLERETPSAQEGGGTQAAEGLLRPRRSARLNRGNLVHRWLEEVEWLEDFAATDEELLALGVSLEPDPSERRAALVELRAALNRPVTRTLLTRKSQETGPAATLEVWRERTFSVVLPGQGGEERLWSGSFDRVVLRRVEGKPVSATVIDYKTDTVKRGRGIDERVEFYRPQVEAYRRIAARMTGLDVTAVTARLAFVSVDEVRDV